MPTPQAQAGATIPADSGGSPLRNDRNSILAPRKSPLALRETSVVPGSSRNPKPASAVAQDVGAGDEHVVGFGLDDNKKDEGGAMYFLVGEPRCNCQSA